MPSHKTHIAIGVKINEKYKFDNDLFYLGCILPDIGTRKHFISHFKDTHTKYNIEKFINKYFDKNNPVMVGYLVHLLTDEFYNRYVRENKFLFDENHKLNGIKIGNNSFYGTVEEANNKKQEGFYQFDKYLVNNKIMPKLNYVNLNKLNNIEECMYNKDYIKEYIDTYNNFLRRKDLVEKYEIFSFDELNNLFNECVKYITAYLDNLLENIDEMS